MQEVSITNLYQGLPAEIPEEIFETLAQNENVKIERIISDGHCSPTGFWYDQSQNEWVMMLDGSARLEYFDGAVASLNAGDAVLIPAHTKHRVASTAPRTVWLAVHF
ncbi:cupin domain-containing protein [Lentisphaerota bacterium ZTH]|nr:cupin domain-containing protein [Lentisphaerota bacterium]WET07143.1 cupin domain-containing protein [Lentisphaerota bacterium ZTH]